MNTDRMWVKAFWGFDPGESGSLGFTDEGDRKSFLEKAEDNDLVLIYGSSSRETAKEDKHQALGFLEMSLEPVSTQDRMSDEAKRSKIENGWQDRWNFGVRAKRAWKIDRRNQHAIQHITKETFNAGFPPDFAKRGKLLSKIEIERALLLPVIEVNVFGEPALENPTFTIAPLQEVLVPTRGINPKFGTVEVTRNDGEHYLYVLRATGCVPEVLGRSIEDMQGKALVKVGYSNDPERRCREHNQTLPPNSDFSWKLVAKSRPFVNGQAGKDAEDTLKLKTLNQFESMGGEFFLGNADNILKAFYNSPGVGFLIKGAAIK